MTALTRYDVAVVGGGVIGLSCAWSLAGQGATVAVVDGRPGSGATWAAAGMLAPVTEAVYTEQALVDLNLASSRSWPAFAAALEGLSGQSVGYRACGTLAVAADAGDWSVLSDLSRFLEAEGLPFETLAPSACRRHEPFLSPGLRGGLLAAEDHQVDPRALHRALLRACEATGVRMVRSGAAGLAWRSDRVVGCRTETGETVEASTTLLATGAWSGALEWLSGELRPPVRPVKGHILRLQGPTDPPLLTRNLRGLVGGRHVYLVPRADGRLVLGATVEEKGFDVAVQAGPVSELLEDARALVPGLSECQLTECSAGLRPGSPDNGPLLGPWGADGLLLATGHYRNGVLL
ncbi:MAG: glycine oxidase ThiO, partial [Acidimicrobiales bacterium]